jgi:hypothetical protein
MVVYITASPSPNRAMGVRAFLDDTTGSVLRLLPQPAHQRLESRPQRFEFYPLHVVHKRGR